MSGIRKAASWARTSRVGIVLSLLVLTLGSPAIGADFYVTTCADNCAAPPAGSLRWAIEEANLSIGADNIRFDGLTGTITLACELPPITGYGTVIMGETADAGGITVEGSGLVDYGFLLQGNACVVRGLTIQNFENYGVWIEPVTGGSAMNNFVGGADLSYRNDILGNWIGIELSGAGCDSNIVHNNRVRDNSGYGIRLYEGPHGNFIGGIVGNRPNSVTGNGNYGIYLGGDVQGNQILGNRVGTNFAGVTALGNAWDGINLSGTQCSGNLVRGNQVCNNGRVGIAIEGGAWENRVESNVVGVDATGNGALGNFQDGILVAELAHDNDIGPGNLISGNLDDGIEIVYPGTDRNDVFQNIIGLNAAATDTIPNGHHGVYLDGVGESEVWENTISGNRLNGVEISGGYSPNRVADNLIGTNGSWAMLGNGNHGIHLEQVAINHDLIGNTIGGNRVNGIDVEETCDNNTIQGNHIGTDPGGTVPIPNYRGISIGSTENWIGGRETGEGNIISHNALTGLRLQNTNNFQIHNHIEGNMIEYNGWHGIAIGEGMLKNFVGCSVIEEPEEAGNVIRNNGGFGILCGEGGAAVPPEENRFMSNSITNNTLGGISILFTTPPGNAGIPAPTILSASEYGVTGVTNLGGNLTVVQLFIDGNGQGETMIAEFEVSGTEDWTYLGSLPGGVNVTATNTGHYPDPLDPIHTSEFSASALTAVGDEEYAAGPSTFRIGPATPNPFGATTTIQFDVPRAGHVSIRVFGATGRLVRTLVDESANPGTHGVTWDASDNGGRAVSPGVYFCRFEHPEGSEMRKLVLLH